MTSWGIHRWAAALACAAVAACGTVRPGNECAGPITPLHAVQGPGGTSPRTGERITVRGVVVGDFQQDDQLAGFFLQQPDADDDRTTSEGLFVSASRPEVAGGDLVQVTGWVEERLALTTLAGVESLEICRQGAVVTPAALSLREDRDLEPYEGMLVRVDDEMIVASTYQLGRYGQLLVAAGSRPFQSTNGEAAAGDAGRRLLIDDGSHVEHPLPPPHLAGEATRRVGDILAAGLTGIVSEEQDGHVLHPTSAPRFTLANVRQSAPPEVGGTVKVASLNLLNFFTTFGDRGASNGRELERQRAKLVAAIEALGADVVGLIELENNGDVALRDLVAALNVSAGNKAWAHVPDPGGVLGGDVLRVGYVYRPGTVRPIGEATADLDSVFKRPPLAQTFEARGERFTVVVNHFKSKRCGDAEGIEKDAGDGQGCWNAWRTRQARRLLEFVARLQETSGDADVLVIGDLNAYGAEDPIRALTTGGLIDQMAAHVPPAQRYSYVFGGDAGYLDHALATPALARQVAGATFWHINCDEPTFLDYNTETNPPELFRPDPFRSSDHDPVLIGLDL